MWQRRSASISKSYVGLASSVSRCSARTKVADATCKLQYVEKIGDLAIRNAEAMFEFGGHGQHDGTKGVARGTDGVGDLLDVARLMPLSATRTEATLDIELCDDWNDRRQVGLILHVDFRIDQFDVAGWTKSARNLDDAIDLCWRRRGPEVGLVSLASARLLAAFLEFGTAKDPRLPMRLAVCFVECAA